MTSFMKKIAYPRGVKIGITYVILIIRQKSKLIHTIHDFS